MKIIFIVCALTFTGCAAPQAPTANIPVAIGCLGPVPVHPVDTFGVGPAPAEVELAKAAGVDLLAYKKYSTGLEVAMSGCRPKGEVLK